MDKLDAKEARELLGEALAYVDTGNSGDALFVLARVARRLVAHLENREVKPGEALLFAVAED